jgi:RHS repeat-associated protein
MHRSNAMTAQRETLLCRYQYDPLDRVVNCAPLNQDAVQRFYRKNRLATEIQGPVRYSVFEHESQLMAQQQQHEAGRVDSALLAIDLQRSVLHTIAVGEHQRPVYAPYGHRSPESGLSSLLGFNGERRDPVTGHYLLGNGYRAFNPVLMRFNSPDSLSPFGKGGVNAYAYCAGDPVNRVDPTGAVLKLVLGGFKDIAMGTEILVSDSRNFFPSLKRPVKYTGRQANAAAKAHNEAVSNFKKVEEVQGSLEKQLQEQSNKLASTKKQAIDEGVVEGSTAYEQQIKSDVLAAFLTHQDLMSSNRELINANIDAYKTYKKLQTELVLEEIRKGK